VSAARATVALLVAMLALAPVLAGCGADDTPDEPAPPTTTTDAVDDDGRPTLPIQVTSPAVFTSVHGSFELAGTAQVHEGELRWSILDSAYDELAAGAMTASCGAPCVGEFATTIDVSEVPIGSWELRVWQPGVADDDPERMHETIIPITVTAQPVDADQPPADAPPPGGLPG
jgi:hypothetical protein